MLIVIPPGEAIVDVFAEEFGEGFEEIEEGLEVLLRGGEDVVPGGHDEVGVRIFDEGGKIFLLLPHVGREVPMDVGKLEDAEGRGGIEGREFRFVIGEFRRWAASAA